MKKMKLKKKKSIKIFIIPLLIYFLILIINILIKDIKLNNNEKFIKKLLNETNFYFNDDEEEKLFDIFNLNLKRPISIIDKVFAYGDTKEAQAFAYIQNSVVSNPKVYIYSTHPNESYLGEKVEGYDLDNNIILASIMLQEKLNSLGVETLVEERSVNNYLKDNNLEFVDSYQATRTFLKEKLIKYDFDLIIDLHRDATTKEKTTASVDGKDYAKVMFVQNVNYKNNISLANKLNDILTTNCSTISRGIYNKYVDNFNQDLSDKVLLIELGGNYNTMDEVINTIDVLANSIKELLNETS